MNTRERPGRGRAGVSRREVLKAGAGALALTTCNKAKPKALALAGRALNAEQLSLCAAAVDRVFPRDDEAGATDLGVVQYIDARLARAGRRARNARERFVKGLGLLSRWSHERHGAAFALLPSDTQDIALASLAAEGGDAGYTFVRQLVVLTMEGVFADPSYGGNKEQGGWRLIGFDAPCPNPRCR